MPLVAPSPGLVAQQKTDSSPHFSQVCFTSSCAPLPVPTTVIVLSQPGHMCFSPTVMVLMCPFSVLTLWIITDLHLAQTITILSPGFTPSPSPRLFISLTRC